MTISPLFNGIINTCTHNQMIVILMAYMWFVVNYDNGYVISIKTNTHTTQE